MSASADRLTSALADRYRIERELGAGGMATVYLAEDLKHKRKVALKVLKPELAAVLGAERFVQEIATTARLQHPHILPLFDSGTADGFLYYVMPFIDGETLRAKLNRETQLGIDEAVKIATDVADALQYAHQHGVIHRDIKPENILLANGRPMVADFGIALAVSAAAGGRMTETGLSLGTPHYMSPEQATAEKEITGRSDIYSLGSVLYEMLTGEPPHTGNSAQQIIMKIITEPAASVTKLRKSVPPNVAATVAKALEKLPADRFVSAAAFAAALSDKSYAGSGIARSGDAVTAPHHTWRRRALGAAGAALLFLGVAAWQSLKPRAAISSGRPWRVQMSLPDSTPLAWSMSLSSDGTALVYDAADRIWLRTATNPKAMPIAGAEHGDNPVISPDGRRVLFIRSTNSGDGQLVILPLEGGVARVLVPNLRVWDVQAWADDETIVYADFVGLMRLPVNGGASRRLTTVDTAAGAIVHLDIGGLPDGNGVVFTVLARSSDSTYIAAVGLDGGPVTRLITGVRATYASPGYLIVTRRDGSIVAVPFDARHHRITGKSVTIASVSPTGNQSAIGRVAVSATGRLIYVAAGRGDDMIPSDLVRVSQRGVTEAVDSTLVDVFRSIVLSPDGRRAALQVLNDHQISTMVRDLTSGATQQVSLPGTWLTVPVFTRDSRSLYFSALGSADGVYRFDVESASPPVRLFDRVGGFAESLARSPAGDTLYAVSEIAGGRLGIVRRALAGTIESVVTIDGGNTMRPQVSPNGRWLAFMTSKPGATELHLRSTDLARIEDWRLAPRVDDASSIRWSRTGDEVFYVANGSLMAVKLTTSPTIVIGRSRALFPIGSFQSHFDVDAEGRFLMIRNRPDLRARTELVMLERWTDLLPR